MTIAGSDTVPVLKGAGDLLENYDVMFCDVWGVLHNGVTPYASAVDALTRFRARGGAVVLVTNSPVQAAATADILTRIIRMPAIVWDAIMTSGDLTRTFIREQGLKRIHHIGTKRDYAVFEGLGVERVGLDIAQGILVTGLADESRETGEHYRPLLETARARNLPLVCGNPDLVVEVGGVLYPCAGAVAAVYEDMGGAVYWAGKPHEPTYVGAHRLAEAALDRSVDRSRIIAVGDALRTDIAGAADYGIDALMIASGIHREELMPDGAIDANRLETLVASSNKRRPVAAIVNLAW